MEVNFLLWKKVSKSKNIKGGMKEPQLDLLKLSLLTIIYRVHLQKSQYPSSLIKQLIMKKSKTFFW